LDNIDLITKVFEAFANSSDSRYVYLTDLKTDTSRWSKSCVDKFGLPGEIMHGAGEIWAKHIHPMDLEEYNRQINAIFSGEADHHSMTYRAMDKTGEYVACTCKGQIIKDDDGNPIYFAGTIDNHSIASEYDHITNLFTRFKLLGHLRELKTKKKEYNILFLGLCNFAQINNIHGYEFGNKLLKLFGERLLDYVKESSAFMDEKEASVFHAGGTKFALVSTIFTMDVIRDIYRDLEDYCRHRITIDDTSIAVNLAGSCAHVDNFDIDEHTVFSSGLMGLDESIYEKHGDLISFNSTGKSNHDKIVIIDTIRNCINNGFEGFYLCFQPIVSSADDTLLGAEALVRWSMEPFGNVPPNEFIAWLENDSLFYDLSIWIFKTAMKTWKEKILPDNPELLLNINVSYIQIDKQTFRNDLIRMLDEIDFPPKNLCLELTERCRFMDLEFLRNEIIFLKSHGIRVALDDFGTGFSAMELLINLPIDTIKIDRTFVMDIENKKEKQYVVKAILECARNLGVRSTVEGIETDSMRNVLKEYGASTLQGYLYSRPVRIEEFVKLNLNGLTPPKI
jgi:EAL domain-containing protein (putative c-di-GMP-specific phosphodiesterase class I)/GGDEF domain-containing protein